MPTSIPISDVVDATFTLSQTAQPNKGFGRLLVVGNSATSTIPANESKLYSAADYDSELILDGYLSTDPEFLALQTWFAQSPKPADALVANVATVPTAADLAALYSFDDSFYFVSVVNSVGILTAAQFKVIADWVESKTLMFGYTDNDVNVPTAAATDLSSIYKDVYSRTFIVYDDNDEYAHISIMAKFATINYLGKDTAITAKFKRLPTVSPMKITLSKAILIRNKNCNYYAYYGSVPLFAEGKMLNGKWIDVIHSVDWLQNAMQTEVFNTLITATTKIPQTNTGVSRLISGARVIAEKAMLSGVLAAGKWRGNDIGKLKNGDHLSNGYYFEVDDVDDMPIANYDAREAPPITFCGRLSGAIHKAFINGTLI